MNKITKSLINIVNKIKRCKIFLKFQYFVLTFLSIFGKFASLKLTENVIYKIYFPETSFKNQILLYWPGKLILSLLRDS